MEGNKINGYGRCKNEAHMNAYKNFFDGIIDNDEMCHHLSAALQRIKENSFSRGGGSRRPPKNKNDIMLTQNSTIHDSYEKNGLSRILQTSAEMSKSKQHNRSLNGSYAEEGGMRRDQSKSKLRQILGRSFMELGGETGQSSKNNRDEYRSKERTGAGSGLKRSYSRKGVGSSGQQPRNGSRDGSSHHHERRAGQRSRGQSRLRFVSDPHDCIYR